MFVLETVCQTFDKIGCIGNVPTVTKEFKRGNRALLTPVLTLLGGGHIAHHIWR